MYLISVTVCVQVLMYLFSGIHGEAGVKKMKMMTAKEIVTHLYEHMTNPSSASHLSLSSGICLQKTKLALGLVYVS